MDKLNESDCLFFSMRTERVIEESEVAYAIRDMYPVTEGHTLIIPRRHVADYFGLRSEEREAIHDLITSQRKHRTQTEPESIGCSPQNNSY